jgi:probable blue pigment (indigoidine) exporter
VTGAALGWAVLGQSLSPVQLTGFVVSLGAIAYGASLRPAATVRAPGPAPASRCHGQAHPPISAVDAGREAVGGGGGEQLGGHRRRVDRKG